MSVFKTTLSYRAWIKQQRASISPFVVESANGKEYLATTKFGIFWLNWVDRIKFRVVHPLRVENAEHLGTVLEIYKYYRTTKDGRHDYADALNFDVSTATYLPYTQWESKHLALCREHWDSKGLGEPYPKKPGAVKQEQPESLRQYQETKDE